MTKERDDLVAALAAINLSPIAAASAEAVVSALEAWIVSGDEAPEADEPRPTAKKGRKHKKSEDAEEIEGAEENTDEI